MIIENDIKLDFSDVLFRPKQSELSSRKQVELKREFTFKHSKQKWCGIPIMASNMDTIGTIEIAKEFQKQGLFTCLHKFYQDIDEIGKQHKKGLDFNYSAISVGAKQKEFEWFQQLYKKHPNIIKFLCIDVANGYQKQFGTIVEKYRNTFPNLTIIAGNAVTGDMAAELILKGADIIKCGIGPGSVCTTRIQTGVGCPQLSAIIECADAVHELGGHIISDGGCTSSGEISKAFGAGADFVMIGGMFAGHDQSGGEKIFDKNDPDRPIGVRFYGMSSDFANKKHFGGLKNYRSSEGREVIVPYRGNINKTIQDILGGIRSTCTYIGAKKIEDLPECTTFIRVNRIYNPIFESISVKK
ncbi:GMP reductase [Pseudomonadota bacterium]